MVSSYCTAKRSTGSKSQRKLHLLRILKNRHKLRITHNEDADREAIAVNPVENASSACHSPNVSHEDSVSDGDAISQVSSNTDPDVKCGGGNFIFNMNNILQFITSFSVCVSKCQTLPTYHSCEIDGAYVSLKFKCKKCKTFYFFENSTRNNSHGEYCINMSVVLAGIQSGLGYSALCDIFSMLNLKFFMKDRYSKIEEKIGIILKKEAEKSMDNALQEEINKSNVNCSNSKLPTICAIGDAQWSKRSYNQNYAANACCGCLIGSQSHKVIYLGVRNKYCYICNNKINKQHTCYKNWNKSSSEMESSIICEGFQNIKKRGAKISKFIADADANTYPLLRITCDWEIQKIDCENHLARNIFLYVDNWRKGNKKVVKNYKTFTNDVCSTVGKILKCKIDDEQYLRAHLPNVPLHVLGAHLVCDKMYCNQETNNYANTNDNSHSLKQLTNYLCNISNRASRLQAGVTSNLVESFFAVNGKLQHGKVKNLIQRGIFEHRCYASCLNFNEGPSWAFSIALNQFSGGGLYFCKRMQEKLMVKNINAKRKSGVQYKTKRILGKLKKKQNLLCPAYGSNNIDSLGVEDNNIDSIFEQCVEFYNQNVKVSIHEIQAIEEKTKTQSACNEWFHERRKRITASNIHAFIRAKSEKVLTELVRRLAYPHRELHTVAVQHGKKYELIAKQTYSAENNVQLENSGLHIHKTLNFIAASPDAIIKAVNNQVTEVLEIKCPFTAKHFTCDDFQKDCKLPASKRIIKYLYNDNGVLSLHKNHDYYYQLQIALLILNVRNGKLIVYASKTKQFVIVNVERNEHFLNNIIPTITSRYFRFYLPEICNNRKLTNKPSFSFSASYIEDKIANDCRLDFNKKEQVNQCLVSDKPTHANNARNYLDFIMCSKMSHTIFNETLNQILADLNLQKIEATADGYCILNSWAILTGLPITTLKQSINYFYTNNIETLATFGIKLSELQSYINNGEYNSSTVDSILDILCTIYDYTAYIFSVTRSDSSTTKEVVIIYRINPRNKIQGTSCIFLLKQDGHYDSLLDMQHPLTANANAVSPE